MKLRAYLSLVPVLLLALGSLLSGCGENAITRATRERREQFAVADDDSIQAYLRRNNLTNYTRTDRGVYIVVTSRGAGTVPIATASQVTVQYVGRVLTVNPASTRAGVRPGQVFDSSFDNRTACGCATFTVGSGLVPGFSEGLTYLRQGDRALLLIPSQQAYGPNGSPGGGILEDSSLLFDVFVQATNP